MAVVVPKSSVWRQKSETKDHTELIIRNEKKKEDEDLKKKMGNIKNYLGNGNVREVSLRGKLRE